MHRASAMSDTASRMDVPVAPEIRRRRKRRRWLAAAASLFVLVLATVLLARLKPAAPLVEKSTIWTDTVKRGEMLRQVRGNGTLVPEDVRWIPALNAGRVERILVLPGTAVKAETVLVELSNPELEQDAFEAESQLKGAVAELANLKVQLTSQRLTQEAAVATSKANYTTAKSDSDLNDELGKSGLLAAITVRQSRIKSEQLATLLEIENKRLAMCTEAATAQLASQEEKISQLAALAQLKRKQIEALRIRAGVEGVLQRLGDPATPLQAGQQLTAGALVARVASQTRLKAAIRIPETQARDVQLDQPVEIDTRHGVIAGHVTRIDPSVENGTVTVDVKLDSPLPRGARPDLTVDGTIQLERLEDVLYVGRPVQSQPESTIRLFKLVDAGREAIRVPVTLGRSSVSTVEILEGLQAGDKVVLSDMSQWDTHDRVRVR